jgi:hypothetical protein
VSPNQIIALAQKRVKDSSSNLDWNAFYAMVIDEIFSEKIWKFARNELIYIHSAAIANKVFNATVLEKALNKIIQMRFTTSYTLVGGIPQPASGTVGTIKYLPVSQFRDLYLDNLPPGQPLHYTILVDNDGTNGMTIALGPVPNASAAIWIDGDFIPSYTINSSPMPILPLQFHRMVLDGVIKYAADEKGMEAIEAKAERRFNIALAKLDLWDIRNTKNRPVLQPYNQSIRKGPFFPSNFPRPFSR